MSTLYVDIETAPNDKDDIVRFMPKFEAAKNIKDPDKKAADIAKKKNAWKSKSQLRSETCHICAVGYAIDDGEPVVRISDDEGYLLKGILGFIGEASKIHTFNGNAFDLPMIERRALVNGIQCHLPRAVSGYYDAKFVDIRERWNPRSVSLDDTVSLDAICRLLGLPTKTGNGKDFYKWDKEKQVEYLTHDVDSVREIAKKMGLHNAPTELGTMDVDSLYPKQEKEDIEL